MCREELEEAGPSGRLGGPAFRIPFPLLFLLGDIKACDPSPRQKPGGLDSGKSDSLLTLRPEAQSTVSR